MRKIALILSVAALMVACNNRKHGNGYIQPVQESNHSDHAHGEEAHGAHKEATHGEDNHEGHAHGEEAHGAHKEATHGEDSHEGHAHGEEAHGEHKEANHSEATHKVEGKVDAAGNFVRNVGDLLDLELTDGSKLHVGQNSTENKIYQQLSDSHFKVSEDKTQNWVALDRTFFESGKSTLTAESAKQLKNIAALLKANPEATVKIGGYTDNTGSTDVNTKVSGERAAIVLKQLTALGVNAKNLKAEGYGPLHPVCEANDTDECKAQNRRVELRITKK